MVLNLLPDSENAKFPFRANAGGNEVTYKLGYIPAARPVQTAIPAEILNNLVPSAEGAFAAGGFYYSNIAAIKA